MRVQSPFSLLNLFYMKNFLKHEDDQNIVIMLVILTIAAILGASL